LVDEKRVQFKLSRLKISLKGCNDFRNSDEGFKTPMEWHNIALPGFRQTKTQYPIKLTSLRDF
jgi:hypothetical protein